MITKLLVFALLTSASFSAASLNIGSFDLVRVQGLNDEAVRRIMTNLQSNDPFVRVSAVQALGEVGDSETMVALICALKDENRYVRAYTAESLGKLHNSRAVQPLIEALHDQDYFVRVHVVQAMGELKDPKTVNPLLALLHGENDSIKPYAAWALGEIKDSGLLRPLIEALKDKVCCDPMADALKNISKEDLGSNDEKWNRWWLTTH